MKKVLLLSYFFPPCQLTASQRSLGWAKTLRDSGWDPIVITRNWEHPIGGPDDMHHDSGTELRIVDEAGYQVHYLPFKGNLRDRLYSKHGKSKYQILRKFLSLNELFFHHFSNRVIAYSNLYDYALEYCRKHPEVKAFIVSGNPFELFRFGYLLHVNTKLPWIADYRDDWNTSEVNDHRGFADGILKKLEQRSEKKWVGTASLITSISPHYVQKIAAFTGRPGEELMNGFFESDFESYRNKELFAEFTVVYNGMLYQSQQIEVFLEALKRLADAFPEHRSKLKMRFPGILFLKHVAERVQREMAGYEDLIEMTERIPRSEVLELQAKAHLLLMVAHKGAIGIPSSKIYEYLGLAKPVLVCPGDHDILDHTFRPYNLGHIAYTADEAFGLLKQLFQKYLTENSHPESADMNYIHRFSRQEQTVKLASLLDRISEHPGK